MNRKKRSLKPDKELAERKPDKESAERKPDKESAERKPDKESAKRKVVQIKKMESFQNLTVCPWVWV